MQLSMTLPCPDWIQAGAQRWRSPRGWWGRKARCRTDSEPLRRCRKGLGSPCDQMALVMTSVFWLRDPELTSFGRDEMCTSISACNLTAPRPCRSSAVASCCPAAVLLVAGPDHIPWLFLEGDLWPRQTVKSLKVLVSVLWLP